MTTIRTKGETRQRLRRFVNLGFVTEWDQGPDGTWTLHTAAGETWAGTVGLLHAFLDGYGQGYYAGERVSVQDDAMEQALDLLVDRHTDEFERILDSLDAGRVPS